MLHRRKLRAICYVSDFVVIELKKGGWVTEVASDTDEVVEYLKKREA